MLSQSYCLAIVSSIVFSVFLGTSQPRSETSQFVETNKILENCGVGFGVNFRSIDKKTLDEIISGQNNVKELLMRRDIQTLLAIIPENNRLDALKVIMDCISIQTRPVPKSQSRVVAPVNMQVTMLFDATFVEYYRAEFCANDELKKQMTVVWLVRKASEGSEFRKNAEKLVEEMAPGLLADARIQDILNENPFEMKCPSAQTCRIFGTVPVQILDGQELLLGNRLRKIQVEEGNCKGRIGYVSERYISF